MHVELFMNQKTNGNSYVVDDGKDCYIVDPGGFDMSSLLNYIDEKKFNLSGILLKDVPVYISEKDYDFLYDSSLSLTLWIDMDFKLAKEIKVIKLKEGDEVFGFKVIETPGHTHGGVCYYNEKEKILMSGDTIFKANYGRTDLPTGNRADMKKSIERLFELPGDTVAYPGHGGEVTIAQNRDYFEYLVKI